MIDAIPLPIRDAALNSIQSWSYGNFGSMEPGERATNVAATLNAIVLFWTKIATGDVPRRRAGMIKLLTSCLVSETTATQIANICLPAA